MKPNLFEQRLLELGYRRKPAGKTEGRGYRNLNTRHDWRPPRRSPLCRRRIHTGQLARYWQGVRTLKCLHCKYRFPD